MLCPSAIKHFVPTDKFFMAGVSIGFNEAMKCGSMDYLLERLRKTYTKLDFVTLDTYSVYENKNSINAFFPFIDPSVNATKQYITFYYRSDYFRTWNGAKQHKLIAGFFDQLRPYFNSSLQFVVVGDKDGFTFPETVIDKRTNAFGKTVDQEYNAIFMKSCFVIGLIGSNMLQPAMFCDFTIHLVPRSKTTIVAEEFFNVNEAAIQNWFNNIYLFGNENLSDLKSGHLVEKTVLLFLTYLAKLYKKDIYTDDYFANRISQVDYLKKNYPYFNLEKAQALKQLVTDESFNYNLKRFRILKALRILRIIKS